MVLDGVLDHTVPLELDVTGSNLGLARALDDFYTWAHTNESSALYRTDVRATFQTLLDEVEMPVYLDTCAQSGKCLPRITKNSVMLLVNDELQHLNNYPAIARGIAEAKNDNVTVWETPANMQATSPDFSYMLGCMDWHTNETFEQWSNRQMARVAFVGYDYTGVTMPDTRFRRCGKWPAPVVNLPQPLGIANTSAPILLVNALLDPATSYDGAVNVQRQIGGSVLLTRRGAGHGSFSVASNAGQAQDITVEYFLTGKTPAPGTVVDT
jgi:hypothetical protein